MPGSMLCPRCWGSRLSAGAPCAYCHELGTVADQVLSPHFLLSELLASQTAVRFKIPNEPPDGYVQRLAQLASELLEPLHTRFGRIHVDSGYRSAELNRAIGGSATSAHLQGWAADLVPLEAGFHRHDLVDWLLASDVAFDQVIFEGSWVHVGLYSPTGNQRRGALMMFPGPDGAEYFPYDPADPRTWT